MPAAIPLLVAVTAGSAIYSGVEANQERQHAKGAQQAQDTALNAKIDEQKKADLNQKTAKGTQASVTQSAAIAALKASMSTAGQMGGTILTGGQGAAPAPIASKTLLGI